MPHLRPLRYMLPFYSAALSAIAATAAAEEAAVTLPQTLVKKLSSEDAAEREAAAARLTEAGPFQPGLLAALGAARKQAPGPELAARCDSILKGFAETLVPAWIVDERWPDSADWVENTPERQWTAAEGLERKGFQFEAAEAFRLLARRFPEAEQAEQALARAGELKALLGFPCQACRLFGELRRQYVNPTTVEVLHGAELVIARDLLDGLGDCATLPLGGRLHTARTLYGRILEEDPYGPRKGEAQFGLAECDETALRFEAAAQAYRRFIEEFPKSSQAGEAQERLRACQAKAKGAAPDASGPVEERPLLEIRPEGSDRWIQVGERMLFPEEKERYEKIKQSALSTKGNPQDDVAYENLGKLFHQAGNYALAAELFVKARQLNAGNVGASHALGTLALLEERWEDALVHLKRVDEADAQFGADAAFRVGLAQEGLRQWDQALPAFERTLRMDAKRTDAMLSKARCLFRTVRIQEAEAACAQALECARDLPEPRRTHVREAATLDRALCRILQGDLDGGAELLASIEASAAARALVVRLKYRLLCDAGRESEARALLERLQRDRPDLQELDARLAGLKTEWPPKAAGALPDGPCPLQVKAQVLASARFVRVWAQLKKSGKSADLLPLDSVPSSFAPQVLVELAEQEPGRALLSRRVPGLGLLGALRIPKDARGGKTRVRIEAPGWNVPSFDEPALDLPITETTDAPVVQEIEIRGNQRTETSRVLRCLGTRIGRPFNSATWEADLERLKKSAYFTDVQATPPIDWPGGVKLVVKVLENPVIRRISFQNIHPLKEEALRKVIRSTEGQGYRAEQVQADEAAIAKLFAERGANEVRVRSKIETDAGNQADLIFQVLEPEGF